MQALDSIGLGTLLCQDGSVKETARFERAVWITSLVSACRRHKSGALFEPRPRHTAG